MGMYPAPIKRRKQGDGNGNGVERMTGDIEIDIPERFTCALTNQIMCEPVIAFDGHTYDKEAIVAHLEQHQKSPVTDERCDGDDEMSFIFDDAVLKKEIDIFKHAYDL